MNSNNTVQILPNIFISENFKINIDFIKFSKIKTVIFINNQHNSDNIPINVIKIKINIDENINFTQVNNLIIETLKKTVPDNILIISKNNLLGFTLGCIFMIESLNISIYKILILDKIYKINFSQTNYFKLLKDYYYSKIMLKFKNI